MGWAGTNRTGDRCSHRQDMTIRTVSGAGASVSGYFSSVSGVRASISGCLATMSGVRASISGCLVTMSGVRATVSGGLEAVSGGLATISWGAERGHLGSACPVWMQAQSYRELTWSTCGDICNYLRPTDMAIGRAVAPAYHGRAKDDRPGISHSGGFPNNLWYSDRACNPHSCLRQS